VKAAKQLQSEQTIARILEAATKLFATHGYHGTSIAAIASAANLTKGALYSHFSSKGDLLFALIREFETRFLDRLIEAVNATPGSASDKLHRFVSFASAFAEENRELCFLLTIISAELHESGTEFEQPLQRVYSKYARFLGRLVEQGKNQGVFDGELDTHSLAYVIIAFHDGILLGWQRARNYLDGPDYVRTFRHVLTRGVTPRKDESREIRTRPEEQPL